ncbi:Rho GTPase protein rac1, partial [Ascosphaera pollenicola]
MSFQHSAWSLPRYLSVCGDSHWPEGEYSPLVAWATLPQRGPASHFVTLAIIEGRYAPYVKRQEQHAEVWKRHEHQLLPEDLDYSGIFGLSTEKKYTLEQACTESVGMVHRVEGVTLAGALRLLMHLRKTRGFNRPQQE